MWWTAALGSNSRMASDMLSPARRTGTTATRALIFWPTYSLPVHTQSYDKI